jgi:hypothetical protein
MTDDALPLDSPRWSTLSTPAGKFADGPTLVRALFDRRSLSLEDKDGPWSILRDRIYHQESVYGATFAVMPYLVRLAPLVDVRDRRELCVMFGAIASARLRHHQPAPPDLEASFARASTGAAEMTIRSIATDLMGSDDAPDFAFGALALAGHVAGKLFGANLTPSSPPEVECECTACGTGYLVALMPDGIARFGEEFVVTGRPSTMVFPTMADRDQPPLLLPPLPSMPSSPTPWSMLAAGLDNARATKRTIAGQRFDDSNADAGACTAIASAVCRAGIDSRTDRTLGLIVAAAVPMLHGEVDYGRQLLRLAGPVKCPECEAIAPLASQMLDFAS